jgi:hypothetical protein
MKATRLALIPLLVLGPMFGWAACLAEETGKNPPEQTDKRKAEDSKVPKPAAPAQEAPAKPTPPQKVVSDEPGYVYTNDDLDRMQPASPATRPSPATAKEAVPKAGEKRPAGPFDPLKRMQEEQASAAELQTQIAGAEKKVTESEEKVRDLERRRLAVANPFLAPPQVAPEQAEQWKKLSGPERLRATDDEIAQARKELEDAKAALQKLRASSGVH